MKKIDDIKLKSSQRINISGIDLEEIMIACWNEDTEYAIEILEKYEVIYDD